MMENKVKKLSSMQRVKRPGQLKPTDFFVILHHGPVPPMADRHTKNVVEYMGRKYFISLLQGTWGNLLKESKAYAIEQFSGFEIVSINDSIVLPGHTEVFAYETIDAMIKECSVYRAKRRVSVIFDDAAIIQHLKEKPSFYSPKNN